MEFVDAQRVANNSPPCTFTPDAPLELKSMPMPPGQRPVGFLSFGEGRFSNVFCMLSVGLRADRKHSLISPRAIPPRVVAVALAWTFFAAVSLVFSSALFWCRAQHDYLSNTSSKKFAI